MKFVVASSVFFAFSLVSCGDVSAKKEPNKRTDFFGVHEGQKQTTDFLGQSPDFEK